MRHPFSFFNVVTEDPPMVFISVERRDGKMKDTSRNAIDKKAFVVHITDESYIEQINAAAKPLPPDQSEVSYAGLTLADSTKIDVPGIREAAIRLECVLEKVVPLGGTDRTPACDLLIGRVVFYHIKDTLYQNGHIDPLKLEPVGRLAGNAYTKLGDTFEIKRPL
jgi:Conserved protein/domain typically associated with flavoprotein oxygenases, DIM6/NTAB family